MNETEYLEKLASETWLPTFLKNIDDYILLQAPSLCVFSHVRLFATPWTIGSSVHGTSQARIPEWVAISYIRGFPQSRSWTHVSCASCNWGQIFLPLGNQILYHYHLLASPFFDRSKSKVKIRRQFKWSSMYWKTTPGKLGHCARQECLSGKKWK